MTLAVHINGCGRSVGKSEIRYLDLRKIPCALFDDSCLMSQRQPRAAVPTPSRGVGTRADCDSL